MLVLYSVLSWHILYNMMFTNRYNTYIEFFTIYFGIVLKYVQKYFFLVKIIVDNKD